MSWMSDLAWLVLLGALLVVAFLTVAIARQVDGYDQGPLGTLYRPRYFYGGVAVHGYRMAAYE